MIDRQTQPGSLHFQRFLLHPDGGFTSVVVDFSADNLPTRSAQCHR